MYTYKKDNLIKSDCSFHIFFNTGSKSDCPIHTHDFIEIVYVSKGKSRQAVNGTEFDAVHGDLLFINSASTHCITQMENFSYYNICFAPETENLSVPENAFSVLQLSVFENIRQGNEFGVVRFSGAERDEIENLFSSMQAEYEKENSFKRAVLESYMSILLVKILRKTLSPGKQKSEWQSLADYIDDNLASDLSLYTLSQKYFYNSSYFSRAFKNHFGVSLTEYIGSRRISLATKLLCETRLTVTEIAARTGYSSKSAFYRAFMKATGKTPSDYRK